MVDRISEEAYRCAIKALLAKNFAQWSIMEPAVWAETIRRMPDEHGATRNFSFDYAPYQREMFDALFDPRIQEVSLMLYSRGGKSEVILNGIGYCIDERPRRILCMWPTLGQAKKWSKDDLTASLIDPTPQLCDLIGDAAGRRKSDNTILHKLFPGGLIDIVGANAPGDLRRAKASLICCDEIDAIVEIKSDEGDQLAIAKKRGSEFADTIEVYASYPSLKRRSRIEAKLLESDYRQWMVPCLHCGFDRWVMHRRDVRYDPDKPHLALLECPNCHDFHDDDARYKMSRLPEKWTATKEFRGKAGFQANALLWPHPVNRQKYPGGYLQMIAQQEIDVEKSDNPERSRRVLVNTVDAETFETECDKKPEHSKLFLRRENYDPREKIPEGVLAIFMCGDIQDKRAEVEIIGFGEKKQTWGLGYHVIKGSPLSPPTEGFWAEIDRLLMTSTFAHPSGKTLRIRGGLFDCGYKPDHVFAFTRPRAKYGIFASRGSTNLARPIIERRARREGNPPAKVWHIGTHEAKDIIYQQLEFDNKDAQGYMHYPATGDYSETYFKMLTAEDSDMQKAGDGHYYRHFHCEEGVRNEALDIRVLAMAVERINKPNYAKIKAELAAKGGKPDTGKIPDKRKTPDQPAKPVRSFVNPGGKKTGGFVQGWRR